MYLVSGGRNEIIVKLDSCPLQIGQLEQMMMSKILILRTGSGRLSFITDVISGKVLFGAHRHLLGHLGTHDESLEHGITKQRNFDLVSVVCVLAQKNFYW